MKCKYCGREIADDSIYCNYCGAKQEELLSEMHETRAFDNNAAIRSNESIGSKILWRSMELDWDYYFTVGRPSTNNSLAFEAYYYDPRANLENSFMEEQRGKVDALMLDSGADGLRVIINDKGGFRDMFDDKGYSYGNNDAADELFGDERDIPTLIEMFGDRVIKPGDIDAIKRFFPEYKQL